MTELFLIEKILFSFYICIEYQNDMKINKKMSFDEWDKKIICTFAYSNTTINHVQNFCTF